MKNAPATPMTRQGCLQLAAGLMSGLGIPGIARAAQTTSGAAAGSLDTSYLEKGLTAMARADSWFDAHWGAGILAGWYLCRDHPLDAATVSGVRRQMDTVIEMRAGQFAPLNGGPADERVIKQVPEALRPAMEGGLRAHGHAVIFAALAMRALRDAPGMARPEVVQRICGLSSQIARLRPQKPGEPGEGYASTQAMIEATFDSLARFRPLLGHPEVRRPNFTHMVTHTEALMSLEMLGCADLAKTGHLGHRVHISAPVPAMAKPDAPREDATLARVMSGEFWTDAANTARWKQRWSQTANPNGDWIASGHLFKVLYSWHQLISRIRDAEQARLCSAILLERYVNPAVQGG